MATNNLRHVGWLLIDECGGVDFKYSCGTSSQEDCDAIERRGYRKVYTKDEDPLGWDSITDSLKGQ